MGRGQRPVISVSWYDAIAFAEWLSNKTGQPFSLSSEAQWEYFARAGTRIPRIHTISGYSAHADQKNLINFIKRMRIKQQHVRLVHGEPEAQATLRTVLENLHITID